MKNLLTVLALCTVMVDVHATPLVGMPVEIEYRKNIKSEAIGGGLYRINFTVPIDVFDMRRSYLIVRVDKSNPSQPSIPYTQLNLHGDNLFVLENHTRRTRWKCHSLYFYDINNHRISMEDIGVSINAFYTYEFRPVHPWWYKVPFNQDIASCTAIANQPFIITIIQEATQK